MDTTKKAPILPGRQRPGGRTEQVRKLVSSTVLALIQGGQFNFSYNEVAEASGINKTTLYRRWPRRADLIREALNEHNSTLRLPKTKTWPESVVVLIQALAEFLSQPTEIAMNIALIADPSIEANSLMLAQWEPIQEQINRIARDAQAKGELSSEIDANTIMLMVVSPLLVMSLFERTAIDKRVVRDMIKIIRRMNFSEVD